MAGSVNSVEILGNLGRDPEVRQFNNGGRVANLSVATSDTWKDRQSGERREKTEWHRVAISADGLVEITEKYLRKGDKVFLRGKLETRKFQDQSGADRYVTEIVVRPFHGELVLLGSNNGGGSGYSRGGDTGGGQAAQGGGYGAPPGYGGGAPAPGPGGGDDLDDEIPF